MTMQETFGLGCAQAPGAAPIKIPTAMRIAKIEQDNYRTRTLTLDGALDGAPGQFVMAWLPRFDEKPFSLVSAAPVTLMITAVGPFTQLVHELKVGDSLWVRGPYGRGFGAHPAAARSQHAALVAGGYGVAPLYWLAQTLLAHDNASGRDNLSEREGVISPQLTVILGARESRDLLYAERFRRLTANVPGDVQQRLLITTDDGSAGQHGRVTDALLPLLDAGAIDRVYGCGPDAMLGAVGELCREKNVPAQLSWEAYMRCGIGLCGSCEHGGRLLCMDGPVLPG